MAADFASMIYGTAQNAEQSQGQGLTQSLQQGASLAQQAEELQVKKAQLQQQKQVAENAKMEKMIQLFETSTKMDPKSQVAFLGKGGMFRQARDNMGLTQAMPDDGLDFMLETPENVARAYGFINDYRGDKTGKVTPSSVFNEITNPAVLGTRSPYLPKVNEMIGEVSKEKIAAEAQQNRYAQQNAIRTDEQAAQAIQHINNDKVLTPMIGQINAVQKGENLLSKNPSWKTVHEVMQDYSSALNPKGNGSDFKLKQFEFNGGGAQVAKVLEAISNDPDQPAPPEVVNWLKNMGANLKDTTGKQIAARSNQLKREVSIAYKHNPNAVQAATNTANAYITGEAMGMPKSLVVNGKTKTVDWLKSFLQAHPDDSAAPAVKKALKDAGEL